MKVLPLETCSHPVVGKMNLRIFQLTGQLQIITSFGHDSDETSDIVSAIVAITFLIDFSGVLVPYTYRLCTIIN